MKFIVDLGVSIERPTVIVFFNSVHVTSPERRRVWTEQKSAYQMFVCVKGFASKNADRVRRGTAFFELCIQAVVVGSGNAVPLSII